MADVNGRRAAAETVREGAKEASVEAVFRTDLLPELEAELAARGFRGDDEDAGESDDAHAHELVVRRDVLRASKIMQDRLLNHPKVEVHWKQNVTDVLDVERGDFPDVEPQSDGRVRVAGRAARYLERMLERESAQKAAAESAAASSAAV